MLKRFLVTVAACVLSGQANGASLDVCSSLALGRWVVDRVAPEEGAVALSSAEARRYIGKHVIVSQHEAEFAGEHCRIVKQTVAFSFDATVDVPGFPYHVEYDCADGVVVPWFSLGRRCDQLVAQLDGWRFYLRKLR